MLYQNSRVKSKDHYEEEAQKITNDLEEIYRDIPTALMSGIFYAVINHYCNSAFSGNSKSERRRLKCIQTRANLDVLNFCTECPLNEVAGKVVNENVRIIDREVPVHASKRCGLGEIDLIMEYGDVFYCVEVKPPEGNHESLLRMVLEIETYCKVLERTESRLSFDSKYNTEGRVIKKAIMFYEKTDSGEFTEQYRQYFDANKKTKHNAIFTRKLINILGIEVFMMQRNTDGSYFISKWKDKKKVMALL